MSMQETTVKQSMTLVERFPWLESLREDYHTLFVEPWSPYIGAMLLVFISMALMMSGMFWGVFGGLKLWGDYFNSFLGLGSALGISGDLDNVFMHRISLMNITLLLGAFSAALLARQFQIRRPPLLEYVWGAVGGALMGIGATLAGGCTTGGFFTPLLFSSIAGWAMWLGLLLGAFLGLKLLLWSMEHISWGMTAPPTSAGESKLKPYYPAIGVAIVVMILLWAINWYLAGDTKLASRAIIVLAGFALGFVLHRSRFCLSRVIREPFMTGETAMTKAMILALAIGIPLGSLLLQKKMVDPYLAIPASFWLGSMLGGLIFGIGMVFAGGCASGSLWRVGEGHLKLVVAAFSFAWVGSIFSGLMKRWGVTAAEFDIDFLDGVPEITALGFQAYLPDLLQGWGLVYLISFIVLLVWYLLIQYNEKTERFTVF